MRVLIDVTHPAHVHFFRKPIALLSGRGHEVQVTSRAKDVALKLLDDYGIAHKILSAQTGSGPVAMLTELIKRDFHLLREVRAFRPQVLAAIGGTFIAHVGKLAGVPSIGFYDTENATLQNAITYPFLTRICVPNCYHGPLPATRHERYAGYHELSYLHPNCFEPDRNIALRNGLAPSMDTFLIRLVSWRASHDIGENGWSRTLLRNTVSLLSGLGRVLISAEGDLPDEYGEFRYRGNAREIHHVMGFCRLVVGESATMASESAMLGVPAIYAAATGRGYTDELECRYGLVRNVFRLEWGLLRDSIERALDTPRDFWVSARESMLTHCVDVAEYAASVILSCAESQRATGKG